MPHLGRRMVVSGVLALVLIFYLFSTLSTSARQSARDRLKYRMSADERLREYLEPDSQLKDPLEAMRSGASSAEQLVHAVSGPSAPVHPFPFEGTDGQKMERVKGKGIFDSSKLGKPASPKPEEQASLHGADAGPPQLISSISSSSSSNPAGGSDHDTPPASAETAEEKEKDKSSEKEEHDWNSVVFDFQQPRQFAQPKTDMAQFANHKAHNHNSHSERRTIATYVCTRNSSLEDPYFAAAQQLVYRTLWDPKSRSDKYPFTVFVAPHITEEQRGLLRGAGALVRELPLVEWNPTVAVWARWRDLFSKLHMWNQTEFDRIAFLDSDAFPVENIDDIFSKSPPQACNPGLLDAEDRAVQADICPYTLSGVEIGAYKEINVGVMVLEPNKAMHARLLRNYVRLDMYDNNYAEQAFLNWQFNQNGPFPAAFLERMYNGYFPQPDEEHKLKIVHEKLWAFAGDGATNWTRSLFEDNWREMLEFYDSSSFRAARLRDDEAYDL